MSAKLLIVEDEHAIRLALSGLFKKEGYQVVLAASGAEALARLEGDEFFDLVITDLALGVGEGGLEVLRAARAHRAEAPVIMITAHGSERIAVEAMKAGAEDYVPKPFDNDQLRLVIRRALERTRLQREHRLLLDRIEREYGFGNIIGSGPAMNRVFEVIKKVAETDLTVLIRGESGTGKELVAQALHQRSPRRERPFVAVNCAAISRELVESELFGHEKGAFTGADARRVGKFEAASGGTIFLDEIGDMPLETQAKVLRVLQERTLERVGGNTPIPIDVRVAAATHRDLEAEVEARRFREDLYYRLKVVQVQLPPLRERLQDLPALAERFLDQFAARLARPRPALGNEALARLRAHAWPGNVRELRNVIEQAAVLAQGPVIEGGDIVIDQPLEGRARPGGGGPPAPSSARAPSPEVPALPGSGLAPVSFGEAKKRAMEAFERAYIQQALEAHDHNISRTAEAIGMVRQSLQQKLRELGIRARREDASERGAGE